MERANLDGAAAFAVLTPRSHRANVVRAAIAFQVLYEYVDTLAELPNDDSVANGKQLHLALVTALDPDSAHPNYYKYCSCNQDNGYIRSLVDRCRGALNTLPSYTLVKESALRAALRIVAYQSLNHDPHGETHALALWASDLTPAGTDLRWWETAAGAASSLTLFPLLAVAGRPALDADETAATEHAYFPWIGSLNQLLDSLIDRVADIESGHHSLIEHYSSIEEAATRLGAIASRAMDAASAIPDAGLHAMILAAMTSYYLSAPTAMMPGTRLVAHRVLHEMGPWVSPTMFVLRARRAAGDVLHAALARA
jgi:tetraprenyl-beta-curcumene synthase